MNEPIKIQPHKMFSVIKKAIQAYGLSYVLESINKAALNYEDADAVEFDLLVKESLMVDLITELPTEHKPSPKLLQPDEPNYEGLDSFEL